MDASPDLRQGEGVTVEAALTSKQTVDPGGAIPLGTDGSGRGLAAVARICSNPECTCQNLELEILTFARQDPNARAERTRLRVRFSMEDGSHSFDWAPGPTGEVFDTQLPDDALAQVEAALADPEVRERIRERWRRARGQAGDPRYPLPDAPLDADRMIYFGEVFPYDFDVAIEHQGRSYVALHAHCLRPGCTCSQMLIDIIGPDPAGARAFVRVPARLPRQILVAEAPWARAVWGRIVDRYGAGFFAERHRRMLALVPASSPSALAPTVSRNAPCPCGSGKKRKRCCG